MTLMVNILDVLGLITDKPVRYSTWKLSLLKLFGSTCGFRISDESFIMHERRMHTLKDLCDPANDNIDKVGGERSFRP